MTKEYLQRYKDAPGSLSKTRAGAINSGRTAEVLKVAAGTGEYGGGVVRLRISTEECDRANDSMVLAGCKTDNFNLNPVIQWGHDGSIPAPASARNGIEIVGAFMEADAFFHGKTKLSGELYGMYADGDLRATSVGFIPLKWEDLDPTVMQPIYPWCEKVRRYSVWELLEFSLCNVPMNPGAVMSDTEGAKSFLKALRKRVDEGKLQTSGELWNIAMLEYMDSRDGEMKALFESIIAQKNEITTTPKTMATTTQKALDQAAAEDLMNQIIPAVKTAIQTILTKANLDFTTTDLQTIASDCAEDVIEMLSGTSDEGTEPAGTTTPADPNAPPAPTQSAVKEAPTFTDELGALNAFLPIHQQELAIAQAALALELSDDGKDFFNTIAEDTPGEIEECGSLIETLSGETQTTPADPGADPAVAASKAFITKRGAKHSKATLKSLTTALTHAKNAQKELKAVIRAGTADPNAEPVDEQQTPPAKMAKRMSYDELMALANAE